MNPLLFCPDCKHLMHYTCTRPIPNPAPPNCSCQFLEGHPAHHGGSCKQVKKKKRIESVPTKYKEYEESEPVYKIVKTKTTTTVARETSSRRETEAFIEVKETEERVIDYYNKKKVRRPIEWKSVTFEDIEPCLCICECSKVCIPTIPCGCEGWDFSERSWASKSTKLLKIGMTMTLVLICGLFYQCENGDLVLYRTNNCDHLDWDWKSVVYTSNFVKYSQGWVGFFLILSSLYKFYKWCKRRSIEDYNQSNYLLKMTVPDIIILVPIFVFLLWKSLSQIFSPWNGYETKVGSDGFCKFPLGAGTIGLLIVAIFIGVQLVVHFYVFKLALVGRKISHMRKNPDVYEHLIQ